MKILKYSSKRKPFEKSWLSKSLERLENDNWGEIRTDESYLITTCYSLRRKPLGEYEIEDLRILIGQNIGLAYLMPLALDTLKDNILAEGDMYEGDLLKAVLTSSKDYWKIELKDWSTMVNIYHENLSLIEQEAAEYKTGVKLIEAFKIFEQIHE